MSDRSNRSARVGIAVYPETKEEWLEAVEEDTEADTLSQLVRVAVSRYLHSDSTGSGDETLHQLQEDLAALNTQQEGLSNQLDTVKGQLNDIRDAVVGSDVREETKQLAQDIYEVLPTEQDLHTEEPLSGSYDPDPERVPAPEQGSVEWLSDRVDASRYRIQAALDYLCQSYHVVAETDDGCYYKEE